MIIQLLKFLVHRRMLVKSQKIESTRLVKFGRIPTPLRTRRTSPTSPINLRRRRKAKRVKKMTKKFMKILARRTK